MSLLFLQHQPRLAYAPCAVPSGDPHQLLEYLARVEQHGAPSDGRKLVLDLVALDGAMLRNDFLEESSWCLPLLGTGSWPWVFSPPSLNKTRRTDNPQ